jgi:hypothetical protein
MIGTRNDWDERLKGNNNEDEGRKFDFHVELKVSFMFTCKNGTPKTWMEMSMSINKYENLLNL